MPEKRIILDLCGGTGAWSYYYRTAVGWPYDVRIVTLPEYDVLTYEPPSKAHGVLAAPPCTVFSRARMAAYGAPSEDEITHACAVVDACLAIIKTCEPEWWALENPATGYLRHYLGEPKAVFEPWQYGQPWNKKTALWGEFVMPEPTHEKPTTLTNRFGDHSIVRNRHHYPHVIVKPYDKATTRAITPAGFAKAFYQINP